jgi:hypothetical protein
VSRSESARIYSHAVAMSPLKNRKESQGIKNWTQDLARGCNCDATLANLNQSSW